MAPPINKPAASGGGYVGVGDITAYKAWGGLRGYTAAYSAEAIDIWDEFGNHPATIGIVNHKLDMDSVGGLNPWIASFGTAHVNKVYDQTGAGGHWYQPTPTFGPPIEVGAAGLKPSYPAMVFDTSRSIVGVVAAGLTQPFTLSAFMLATAAGGNYLANTVNFVGGFAGGAADASGAGFYAFNSIFEAATVNAWHALNNLANGPASYIYVDTTAGVAQDASTGTINTDPTTIGRGGGGFDGKICEVGTINADRRSNFVALGANMRAFWLP